MLISYGKSGSADRECWYLSLCSTTVRLHTVFKMLDWKNLGSEYALDQLFKAEYLQLATVLNKSPKFFSPNSQCHELYLIYLSEA